MIPATCCDIFVISYCQGEKNLSICSNAGTSSDDKNTAIDHHSNAVAALKHPDEKDIALAVQCFNYS